MTDESINDADEKEEFDNLRSKKYIPSPLTCKLIYGAVVPLSLQGENQ